MENFRDENVSEFLQFIVTTVLFAAILLVSCVERWNSGILVRPGAIRC